MFAIEAEGLQKSYGSHVVLAGVDLRVPAGSVFALLGQNGAGKTTMVRILSTLSRATGGRARVAGHDVVSQRRSVRRSISLTGQYAALDDLQTGSENLVMIGRLSGLSRSTARSRAAGLLASFDLVDAGRRRVATYSGGMRRRLDLAASLIREPSVIFLDEPTTGLDLPSRQTMWTVVRSVASSGRTVFLTTQYLEEADQLADDIAVLHDGRVVASGSPAALKDQFAADSLDDVFLRLTGAQAARIEVAR
jgi:ABC-2 type transport system ATP-binding protein